MSRSSNLPSSFHHGSLELGSASVRRPGTPASRLVALALSLAASLPSAAVAGSSGAASPWRQEAAAPANEGAEARRKAAVKRLSEIMAAYRSAKGVVVKSGVTVAARGEGAAAAGGEVVVEFVFGPKRQVLMRLRDFEIRAFGGRMTATHATNPLAYLDVSDEGSPYWQIFGAFQALPFPELALALGEDDPGETCMQLLPQIPNVVPVELVQEEVEGQVADVLVLASDDGSEELRLFHDPETKLLKRSVGIRREGAEDGAEPGAETIFTVRSTASVPTEPPGEATFRLEVGSRQKVDGLAALVDRSAAAEEDREVEALKAGEPAPELVLPRAGEPVDFSLVASRPRPVVVDFFATWCGPCIASLPELSGLSKEFEGRAEVILVNTAEQGSREDRERRVAEGLAKRGAKLPVVLDLDGQAARRWLVRAFPTTFLVAPDGRIAGVWVGSSPRNHAEMRRMLGELCAEAKPAAGAGEPAPK